MLAHNFFEVHGTIGLSLEDRILTIEGDGPWNIESVYVSDEKVKPFTEKLAGKPWAVMVILGGEPIHVPEATELLIKIVKQDKKNGRVATAVILNQSNSPEFGKRHIGKIYSSAGEPYEFFDDEKTALAWLHSRLEGL